MKTNDFSIFCALLADVHRKAFGEPLDYLPYGKAQVFGRIIKEATGDLLSYKSLHNFALAVLQNTPESVNPSAATLSILVRFLHEEKGKSLDFNSSWYAYRSQLLSV